MLKNFVKATSILTLTCLAVASTSVVAVTCDNLIVRNTGKSDEISRNRKQHR